jgi:hypothetical protein
MQESLPNPYSERIVSNDVCDGTEAIVVMRLGTRRDGWAPRVPVEQWR